MPCDRMQLLFDYARLCAQTSGDSYGTAQNLLGHLTHSLNLPYAVFLLLDPSRNQINGNPPN